MKQAIKSQIASLLTTDHLYMGLLSGSLIIFTSSILANGFSFLFNLATARNLSVENYGVLQTMLNLLNVLMTLNIFASIQLTKQLSIFTSKKNSSSSSALVNKSNLFVTITGVTIFTLFIIMNHFLNISIGQVTSKNLLVVILLTILGYQLAINKALMKANLMFAGLALNSILQAASRLILLFPFIFLGFKLHSAIWALVISSALAILYSIWQLRGKLFFNLTEKINLNMKAFTKDSAFAMVGVMGLVSLTSADLILVQYYLTNLAGFYAGLTLFGKAIILTTAPLSIVLFPTIINAKTSIVGKRLFKFAILGVFVLASLVSMLYLLIPKQIIAFALTPKYYTVIPLLPYYALSILLYTISSIIVNGFIALDRFIPGYLAFLAAVIQIIGIMYFHNSLYSIITVSLVVNIGLAACLILFTITKLGTITKKYYGGKKLSTLTS